jgi:nucleotide-binding universal stress UspA family protein
MTMTHRILCPIDGTDHAAHAVDVAADLATKYGAELLICVVNVAHGGGRGPLIHHWSDADAQKILDDGTAIAVAKGVTPTGTAIIIDREAASGIVTYAVMNKVDHIVMGTGDKRGLSRLVLGSVAADVAGRAHCTVTIAR